MAAKKKRPIPEPYRPVDLLIDAHTHLASMGATEPAEVTQVVAAAREVGVGKICTVGDGIEEARQALAAAMIPSLADNLWAACAIHPTRAATLNEETKAELAQMAENERCVAVGETGLDTYWISRSEDCADIDTQLAALEFHAELAHRVNKVLMIHNREADQLLMDTLPTLATPYATMLHCFSSPIEIAREAIDRGYVLSFAGNVTFKANEHLRQAAAEVPLDQLFIETDAPFMTPEPYRGAKNSPRLIGHTAACIAEVRGIPVEEVAEAVSANFDRLYLHRS